MSIAPLPRLSNANWLRSHNKHCNSMTIVNYSTLLIGDSIITGLSRYSNIWKRYFQPLNAINCGMGGDRVQNTLWRCHNLPSSRHPQNAVIMCGNTMMPTQFCRRYCRWDCRNRTLIKAQTPSNCYICLRSPPPHVIITAQSIEFI